MNIALRIINFCYFLFILSSSVHAQKPKALPFVHAHNDYEKIFRKDFKSAVKAGCTSIEIDVFPRKGRLKIAHIPLFLNFRRDLEQRYLLPLRNYIAKNGHLYSDPNAKLILMVDVKRNAAEAYAQLKSLGEKYCDLLTIRYAGSDSVKQGPIEILVSGSKPYDELLRDSVRYMQIDGGFGNIGDPKFNSDLVPRVSSSYGGHFEWRGRGEISEKELAFLRDLVKRAHNDGRQVRFWAMPNRLKVWELMRREGVDWLNVDRIKKLKWLKKGAGVYITHPKY
jgi:hypothetical protein